MKENNKCIVQFKYKYNGSKNDKVGVVGNLDILNKWNIDEPVNLYYSEKDGMFISNQLSFPQDIQFEYKYVYEHKWEDLPFNMNRKNKINNESLIFIDTQGNEKTEICKLIMPSKNVEAKKDKLNENSKKEKISKTKNQELNKKTKKKDKSEEQKVTIKKEKDINDQQEKPKTIKKKVIKKKKKKKVEEIHTEEIKKVEEKPKRISLITENIIDPNLEKKLKSLDYDSDINEEKDKEKEQKQKEPQQSSDIKDDDDIIMCSFNLPLIPAKQNDSFILKLTNSPLYHILYKVIEKEKNIKWFGSLREENIYTEEEREQISRLLKEKNMYLINVDNDVYEKTKILYYGILEPLCHYITLDENDMDNYVNFSEYWKEYKKYI